MLGTYLKEEFSDQKVTTLGINEGCDFKTDLIKDIPDFGEKSFNLVIHTAGTEQAESAMALNLEGTKKLVEALKKNPPRHFVYISSYKVYSRDAGENVNEDTNTWASDDTGKSKALAEEFLRDWSGKNDVILTIIRPARMFGNGVKGETLMLFNDALSGKYIHVRGNDAKVSLVCALDVSRGVRKVYEYGGVYNAADGRPVKFIDMIEAMTANLGAKKRMTHLPATWAEWLWRLGRWVPSINRNLSPDVVENRMKTLTLDGSHFAEMASMDYHDTIAVIEKRDTSYPYSYSTQSQKQAVHEV